VLIHGESGTGKELVARALHASSPRHCGPFLAINCGGLPDTLLESELFGYRRGAFTGADADKPGLVEAAHGGSLLLDEVADLSPTAQTKLLRVLQEGEVLRLGGVVKSRVDVRVLAATHKSLEEEVREGRFRQDLLYRLWVVGLEVPPLRARAEDIPLLVEHFLERYGDGRRPGIAAGTLDFLGRYSWPGNVRELENEVRRALALLGDGTEITPDLLSERVRTGVAIAPATSLKERMSRYEAGVLRETLEQYSWNKTRAARALGVSRQSLIRKVARHRLLRPGGPRPRQA
jgi:two-component system response regulator HupR/HoxA